jgi:hypothetical protein
MNMIKTVLKFIAITLSIFFFGVPGILIISFGNSFLGISLIVISVGLLIITFQNELKPFKEKLSLYIKQVKQKNLLAGLIVSIILLPLVLLYPATMGMVFFFSGLLTVIISILYTAPKPGGNYVWWLKYKEAKASPYIILGIIVGLLGFLLVLLSGNGQMLFGSNSP